MTRKDVLLVFVKRPVLGRVKTRLADSIGARKALDVYERLLAITCRAIAPWPGDVEIHVAGPPVPFGQFAPPGAKWYAQFGEDLGARMSSAFQEAFSRGADRVVLIGSDLPDITSELIRDAFAALGTHEVVLGPASDGGYYLIGMRSEHAGLFSNMAWSTKGVFRETVHRLEASGRTFHLLPTLGDIDDRDDLLATGWVDMLG